MLYLKSIKKRKDDQKNLVAKIIKPKLGLLELSRQLGSVTQVCKVFGYSRDSFYDFKKLYEEWGELALRDIVRLSRANPKNRVDPEIKSRVVKIALDNPALEQQRVSNGRVVLHRTNFL